MLSSFRDLYRAYLCLTALVVVVYSYVAATASAGPRKGRARMIAVLAFISFFIVSPVLWTVYESRLPVFEADGVIRAVEVRYSGKGGYDAWLWIASTDGGEVPIHVFDYSRAWHVGQHLRVRYYGHTGELIRADLMSPDGHAQGMVRNSSALTRVGSVLSGILVVWAVLRRYRRDPEALTPL